MSRKKGHGEHMDESWLIPYADILTLLLALFIVLFSSSSLDLEKYQKIMQALSGEFRSTSGQGGGGGGDGGGAGDFFPDDWEELLKQQPGNIDGQIGGSQIEQLYSSFSGYISTYDMESEMQVKITGESLLLTLTSDIWFPSGSAVVSPSQRETAQKIAAMIRANMDANSDADIPFNIVITGHTDNMPIATSQFPSNWYLSATRAINFMEAMLRDSNLDPRMFSARGYGEYDPVDTNSTPEGRQHNRRVEVLISLDKFDEKAEIKE